MIKNLIFRTASIVVLLATTLISGCSKDYIEIMAVTGATPLAIREKVPQSLTLKVDGMVKKEYVFKSDALNAFSSTRIRTREVSKDGRFLGTYIYNGIPAYNILEGVAPEKPKSAAFDKPLDMLVVFTSSTGKKSVFSYGELIMTDDSLPVTLAFHRKQLLPTTDREKYDKNVYRENIKGLRLICPRESDDSRYLDDVVKMTLVAPKIDDSIIPSMKKGAKCESKSITCLYDGTEKKASFEGIPVKKMNGIVRVGHGKGFKTISDVQGYGLKAFIEKNFPEFGESDYFLFVACDGYRSILSAREIYGTRDGDSMIIANKIDGKAPQGKYMLMPSADYFVDRNVWGLSHILLIKQGE